MCLKPHLTGRTLSSSGQKGAFSIMVKTVRLMEQGFDLQVPETTSAHLLNESYAEVVIGAFEKGLFKLLIFMPQVN